MAKSVWMLMLGLLWAAGVYAADHKPAAPVPKVDPELLEFLGSWQGSDGGGVDPMMFARIDPKNISRNKTQKPAKPVPSVKQPPNEPMEVWGLQP
ncbi:MAG: hypothetical protein KGL13_01885 [Gammaproteobacteria bacterium]|nr:hypothetical protein [Gammaproteobacteria bacterium]MDE2345196.1 hypothetical protein [Gammaproteobacteria bacterium]